MNPFRFWTEAVRTYVLIYRETIRLINDIIEEVSP
jgi:hypothetical protein